MNAQTDHAFLTLKKKNQEIESNMKIIQVTEGERKNCFLLVTLVRAHYVRQLT